jgi:hypothetical protein
MAWSLSEKERADTAARVAANIATLAFFRGAELTDADAAATAAAIERKAYTAATVAARTTTGHRPAGEIASGYARRGPEAPAARGPLSCGLAPCAPPERVPLPSPLTPPLFGPTGSWRSWPSRR